MTAKLTLRAIVRAPALRMDRAGCTQSEEMPWASKPSFSCTKPCARAAHARETDASWAWRYPWTRAGVAAIDDQHA